MKKLLGIIILSVFVTGLGIAADLTGSLSSIDTIGVGDDHAQFPAVFQIGENPEVFEALSGIYKSTLITACEDNMDIAFTKWMDLIIDIEAFAHKKGFDLNGSKMWIKFFWGSDGSVEHLAFHLKPNSRNIDVVALAAFFKGFIKEYKFPNSFDASYSHYSSASFPTFYKRALSE